MDAHKRHSSPKESRVNRSVETTFRTLSYDSRWGMGQAYKVLIPFSLVTGPKPFEVRRRQGLVRKAGPQIVLSAAPGAWLTQRSATASEFFARVRPFTGARTGARTQSFGAGGVPFVSQDKVRAEHGPDRNGADQEVHSVGNAQELTQVQHVVAAKMVPRRAPAAGPPWPSKSHGGCHSGSAGKAGWNCPIRSCAFARLRRRSGRECE